MQLKVTIDQKTLNAFKRRARKTFPTEHCEAAWGKVTLTEVIVDRLVEVPYTAGTDGLSAYCNVTYEEWDKCAAAAKEAGLDLIGSIHSHPADFGDSITFPSSWDNESAVEYGEQIIGIYSIEKDKKTGRVKKTNVSWYLPQRPIEVVHK